MGNCLCCGSGKKLPDKKTVQGKKIKVPQPNETPSSSISGSNTAIHSSEEILDEDFKSQITEAIDEHMTTIPTAFQTEHDRIVSEMKRCAPERYLGLLFSEYPDENGPMVDEMARRAVISKEAKRRLADKITERVEPSFQSRTANWNESSREAARPMIKIFIEKLVNDAFERAQFQ